MTEVAAFHKPEPDVCPCGCGLVGRPRVKAWKDGLAAHVRVCRCRRCKASSYRRNAAQRERRLAKRTGGSRSVLSGAVSGADVTGPVDIEETSAVAVTRGFRRWVESQTVSRKRARLVARAGVSPRVLVLVWPGGSWAVMTTDDLVRLVTHNTEPVTETGGQQQ